TSRYHIIDPLLFSSPAKVISLLSEKLIDGSLLKHLVITLGETLIGFFIGTILGIGIATVLWLSEKTAKISDPYLVILNSMTKVELGQIIIVVFGLGYISIIL